MVKAERLGTDKKKNVRYENIWLQTHHPAAVQPSANHRAVLLPHYLRGWPDRCRPTCRITACAVRLICFQHVYIIKRLPHDLERPCSYCVGLHTCRSDESNSMLLCVFIHFLNHQWGVRCCHMCFFGVCVKIRAHTWRCYDKVVYWF